MNVGSVCSGIGAPEKAWEGLGWRFVFMSEIEPFPAAVLAARFPTVPNLGDMLKIDGETWRGKVDILVGGTPCQAFSVAGLRRALADERGDLTLKFVELANAIRSRFVIWENVPGVLNTRDNAFGCFLGGLAGETLPLVPPGGRWTDAGYVLGPQRAIAWRCLDAQYFGLAQRRKRVFVVACPRDGADPREVLFERESLRLDSPPRREAGKDIDPTVSARTKDGGGCDGGLISAPLRAHSGQNQVESTYIAHTLRGEGGGGTAELSDVPSALRASQGGGDKPYILTSAVRRLTPREYERLQGFPDGFTLVNYRGKPAADGNRYKAIGNSMAVPVLRWIGERIAMVERIDEGGIR